ncbi:RNA polymerase subunit sigma-70 [Kineococcus glutinatus]|uniref:Homeodomain-like domain-containing protein n=1 Tax=Kineococcus glutinatus TaxID=1070872 RepID=A0ABP9HRS2_9ACTN
MSHTHDVLDSSTSSDPAVGLRGVAALRRLTEQLEELQVHAARRLGWSWADIAAALGVSKQAVHKKHAAHAAADEGGH